MRRLLGALTLLIVGLTGCTLGTPADYPGATVVWGLGYPTTEIHRITWQIEGDQVARIEQQGQNVTETSYELADHAQFQRALHEALQTPEEMPPCQDANAISIQATDARGDQRENWLQQCARSQEAADALLDALEAAG